MCFRSHTLYLKRRLFISAFLNKTNAFTLLSRSFSCREGGLKGAVSGDSRVVSTADWAPGRAGIRRIAWVMSRSRPGPPLPCDVLQAFVARTLPPSLSDSLTAFAEQAGNLYSKIHAP